MEMKKQNQIARFLTGLIAVFVFIFQLDLSAEIILDQADQNGQQSQMYSQGEYERQSNMGDFVECCPSSCCSACCPDAPFSAKGRFFIAMDNGYRWDRISNRATIGGPTVSVKGSTQILKNINTYQLGARGQWNFYDCAFIRGDGHYGWAWDGKYSEGGFFGDSKGHTCDGEGAIGYYLKMAKGIWVAPVIGWSYNALDLKGDHITTDINGHKYHLSDIKAHQRFNGPYFGFDLAFQPNSCYEFTFAYEFHYARWQGQRAIQGPQFANPPFGFTTSYSNTRHVHRVYGQVFRLGAAYQFCDCWTAGLDLKYQFYTGDHGRYKQTKKPLLPEFTYANVDGLWWRSFAATIVIGRMF